MKANTITTTNNGIEVIQDTEALLKQWSSYIDASERTVCSYTKAVKRFLTYLQANNITAPTREDVLAYKKEMQITLAPSSVQLNIVALRAFFEWAEQSGIYPNIAKRIKGMKINPSYKKDDLSIDSLKCILATIDTTTNKGKRDYALFLLLSTCGLRTIEATRANVEDVRSTGNKTVLYIHGKGQTDKTEFVVIPYEVEQALRVYLRTRTPQEQEPLFASVSNHKADGGRLTTRSIRRLIKEYMVNAGYDSKRLTTHSLRHSAVTISIASGIPLDVVQAFARHKNIATTMLYNHRVQKINNPCSNAIAGAISL